jgi:hypothetical protein
MQQPSREKPVLNYHAPNAQPPIVTRWAQLGAVSGGVVFFVVALGLRWIEGGMPAAVVALTGAVLCSCVALGLVKTRLDRKK